MLDQALRAANDTGVDHVSDAPSRNLRVALVGNFTPRLCGIATFTRDVHEALVTANPRAKVDVVAMTDVGGAYEYPPVVKHEIRQNELEDYVAVARALNDAQTDVLCLQHEYGIFGGEAGEHILTLLYNVKCPVVSTLHTVLQAPNPAQRRVMAGIIARSAKLIVMAEKGKELLKRVFDVPDNKIVVVPHGAPDRPFCESDAFKPALGLEGREVILTFGLLSPNKGIENVIAAMPAIKKARPNATYVVLGATHPHLVAREGEAYREKLVAMTEACGGADCVRFVNSFVDQDTLLKYLSAADVYISPYLNEAQITSGTLTYAVALGKPVISTPYWHASELLANDTGYLVPFGSVDEIGNAVIELLGNTERRDEVRQNAYAVGRGMLWERLAERYLAVFSNVRMTPPRRPFARADLPQPNLGGVARMTDDCGIAQHTTFGIADRAHGYCVDDNCRGLLLINRYEASGRTLGPHERLTDAFAAFVNHAWNPDTGRFRNFMGYDRRWLEEAGSPDSFGRTFWALGETVRLAGRADLRMWAEDLVHRVLPYCEGIESPRARAFIVLGLAPFLAQHPDCREARGILIALAEDLLAKLREHSAADWTWFEPVLAYDNARLPEALIRAGLELDRPDMTEAGVKALSWLCGVQRTPQGQFRAYGVAGFGKRLTMSPPFDQQPVEVAATIDACAAAFEATGDTVWVNEARRAFDWYFGANDLGVALADPVRGVCYDGLTPERANLNQGAESVLSFQLATCAMHALTRAARATPTQAVRR